MTSLNFSTFKPLKTSSYLGNICFGNCPAEIKGLLWINQQLFWTYQCLCCKACSFEPGKTSKEWGGLYD